MIKNGAAHCPTNSAQPFFPDTLRIAEAIIDPTAKPRYTLDGAPDVMDSIAPVNRSSEACPSSTLVLIPLSPAHDFDCRVWMRPDAFPKSRSSENRKLLSTLETTQPEVGRSSFAKFVCAII